MNNRKLERRTCRRNWNINGRQRETLSVCLCHSLPPSLSLSLSVTNYSGQKCTINIKLICSHGNAQSVQIGSLGFNMHFEHKSWLRRICLWIAEEQQHRPQLATFTGRATMLQHTHMYIRTAWLAVFMNENANSCRSLATCRMRNARRAATVGGRKIKRRVNWRRLAGGAVGCQRSTWSCATGNTNTPPHLASSLRGHNVGAQSVTLCVKNIISLAARRARRQ